MSLKGFHVFFIAVCLVLAAGVGIWGIRDYLATAQKLSLYLGAGSIVSFFVLGVYGVWFMKKLKHLSYV